MRIAVFCKYFLTQKKFKRTIHSALEQACHDTSAKHAKILNELKRDTYQKQG